MSDSITNNFEVKPIVNTEKGKQNLFYLRQAQFIPFSEFNSSLRVGVCVVNENIVVVGNMLIVRPV